MPKIKMKKNCLSCKAYDGSHEICELGYKTEPVDLGGDYGGITYLKPIEVCPKPKTIKAYIELRGVKK